VCDWNDDQRLDLVVGERNGYLTLFLRTEAGTLTNAGRIQAHGVDIQTGNNSWPFVVDWNEDGRKDLLVGQEGISQPCNVFVYLNQGTDTVPVFADSTPVLNAGAPINSWRCAPVTEDLDRDGRKDLVLGEWYSSVRYYHNSGTNAAPVFSGFINLVPPDPDSFLNGNPPRINFADWDGDGDRDMVTCDYYGSVFLRRNVTPTAVRDRAHATLRPGIRVSPNPVRAGTAVLRLALPSRAGSSPARLLVVDASGRMVWTGTCAVGESDADVRVESLTPGVYHMRIGSDDAPGPSFVVLP
jgi:hypothetical protein